jgi:hypothetical protein
MRTAAPQYGHGLVGVAIVGFPYPFARATVTRVRERKQRSEAVSAEGDPHDGQVYARVRA